ncbi:PASTA domain-containing protein [Amphritea sp. 1_MG-2023]|uniref:PASTA domain-containing protein n=1 Tax=Amphritea sp. 1_MG-2023 TaxID=3062670 RepID=UPI0026E13683|nr:PASTA domain-containing protein [Amphritea sp. 1_MG-2023]MDO6564491.1 PASTA domain-containing protein [Amphritea sp. 1_MG-2023]
MAENPFTKILATPLGDMIAEMGIGVAQAQYAIDAKTIENLKQIYSLDDDLLKEMRRIGYRPTWYVIPEAEAEISMALTVQQSIGSDRKVTTELKATTVDAAYQNQYDFKIEGASKLKLTFRPVPAPLEIDNMQVVPLLSGIPLGEAKALLEKIGIDFQVSPAQAKDSAIVSSTQPVAGAFIDAGSVITVGV